MLDIFREKNQGNIVQIKTNLHTEMESDMHSNELLSYERQEDNCFSYGCLGYLRDSIAKVKDTYNQLIDDVEKYHIENNHVISLLSVMNIRQRLFKAKFHEMNLILNDFDCLLAKCELDYQDIDSDKKPTLTAINVTLRDLEKVSTEISHYVNEQNDTGSALKHSLERVREFDSNIALSALYADGDVGALISAIEDQLLDIKI